MITVPTVVVIIMALFTLFAGVSAYFAAKNAETTEKTRKADYFEASKRLKKEERCTSIWCDVAYKLYREEYITSGSIKFPFYLKLKDEKLLIRVETFWFLCQTLANKGEGNFWDYRKRDVYQDGLPVFEEAYVDFTGQDTRQTLHLYLSKDQVSDMEVNED